MAKGAAGYEQSLADHKRLGYLLDSGLFVPARVVVDQNGDLLGTLTNPIYVSGSVGTTGAIAVHDGVDATRLLTIDANGKIGISSLISGGKTLGDIDTDLITLHNDNGAAPTGITPDAGGSGIVGFLGTLLTRLSGKLSIKSADGDQVTIGNTADVAVAGDNPGTLSGKLRYVAKVLASVWNGSRLLVATDPAVVQQTDLEQIDGNSVVSAATGIQKVGIADSGGASVTTGQKTMANSLPVVLASDQGTSSISAIPLDGTKSTFSAGIMNVAVAALATDVFGITGPQGGSTRKIRVLAIGVSATQTTAGEVSIQLIRRNTNDNSGGTMGNPSGIRHDENDNSAVAQVRAYTANPSSGSLVGTLRSAKLFAPAPASASAPSQVVWTFGDLPGKAIVLRQSYDAVYVNLLGVTVIGGSFNFWVMWTEEP